MKNRLGSIVLIGALASSMLLNARAYDQAKNEPQDEGFQFLKRAFCPAGNLDKDLEPGSEARQDFEEIREKSLPWCAFFGCSASKEDTLHAIQDFVYERSRKYAYNRTKDNGQAHYVAQRIQQDLHNESARYVDKYNPRYGAFRSFIGGYLHEKVQQVLNNHHDERPHPQPTYPQQSHEPQSYRPSNKYSNDDVTSTGSPDSCPTCTDSNIPDNEVRVYLPKARGRCRESGLYDSCGHWMCIACAAHNFLKENRSKCPFCNQDVNSGLLKKILRTKADGLEKTATKNSKEAAILRTFYNDWPGGFAPSAPAGGHW